MNKIKFKLRGVTNDQALDIVEKYFIDVSGTGTNAQKIVRGRPKKDDGEGGKLNYFPDYLVIPTDPNLQTSAAEAFKQLAFIQRHGGKVSVLTEDANVAGKSFPKGTYVIDMKQGARNFIYEIMGKGYDATAFSSMYADIYCNYPDSRGFTCVEVWNKLTGDLLAAKLDVIDYTVTKGANILGKPADYIVFKSSSTDAVRFVNLLLAGKSSGPSVSDGVAPVWMLHKALEDSADGYGRASDYVMRAEDLYKLNFMVDNPDHGLNGCQIDGKYIADLPKAAHQLVKPIIRINTTKAAASGGITWWALDHFFGFDVEGYSGGTRAGANVYVQASSAISAADATAMRANRIGLVNIQTSASLTNALLGTGNTAAPTTSSIGDIGLYGVYNEDGSMFSANYESQPGLYARGNSFTGNIPANSKIMFRVNGTKATALMGGYGSYTGSYNRPTMFATVLKSGFTNGPVQSVTMGTNMFNRSHYQIYYPILGAAIFAASSQVLDDQVDPVITDIAFNGGRVAISATDDDIFDSGLTNAPYALYKWNAAAKDYAVEAVNESGEFNLENGARYMAVVTDWAGNEAVAKFAYIDGKAFCYDSEAAFVYDTGVNATYVDKKNGNKNDLTIKVAEYFYLDGKVVFTRVLSKKFEINNNAAGTYDVYGYKVYVDTKGNTQIRELKIVDFVAK